MIEYIKAQRKFTLAVIFTVSLIAGLFVGTLTGGEFVMGMSAILALYGASNVMEKR